MNSSSRNLSQGSHWLAINTNSKRTPPPTTPCLISWLAILGVFTFGGFIGFISCWLLITATHPTIDALTTLNSPKDQLSPSNQTALPEGVTKLSGELGSSSGSSRSEGEEWAQNLPTGVTIVTAYFELQKAKHSTDEYEQWMSNWLPKIETPLVVFTTRDKIDKIAEQRKEFVSITQMITDYEIFAYPSVREWAQEYKTHQREIDPEKHLHSAELYAIWASKEWMTLHVVQNNPFNSKFFVWADIGSFRYSNVQPFRRWPDVTRMEEAWKGKESAILLGMIGHPESSRPQNWWVNADDENPQPTVYIQGTFFAGTAVGIEWFAREFYRIRDKWIRKGHFVGMDQRVMTTVAGVNWRQVMALDVWETGDECKMDGWFYFQHWLAGPTEGFPGCPWLNVDLLPENLSS
eukprot:TRINITY_DN1577_c0_g1_i1.p1 TRINITY_DN1577_c0_g1~~TRINITY_DN1577_c0_g1_i1.p1  ORF type:complete len:406 (-),score=3.37 TRINITY_DN1577_c0_g1_i1:303-1520(-)